MQTQSISFPRLGYSLAELEVLVGLSRSTLHRMVARGELETVKLGRRRFVPVAQVLQLCNAELSRPRCCLLSGIAPGDSSRRQKSWIGGEGRPNTPRMVTKGFSIE